MIDLAGVFGNALLGGAAARVERFDPVGFGALAIASGLGGGMIRDVLLQRGTPVALTDFAYLATALAASLIAFVVHIEGPRWHWTLMVVDAFALGSWAAAGAQKTLSAGLGWLPAVLLGIITAVGGGVLRDVLLRRIPTVFGGGPLYATCALIASVSLVILSSAGHPTLGTAVGIFVGGVLCLAAHHRGWYLPAPLGRARDDGAPGTEAPPEDH